MSQAFGFPWRFASRPAEIVMKPFGRGGRNLHNSTTSGYADAAAALRLLLLLLLLLLPSGAELVYETLKVPKPLTSLEVEPAEGRRGAPGDPVLCPPSRRPRYQKSHECGELGDLSHIYLCH